MPHEIKHDTRWLTPSTLREVAQYTTPVNGKPVTVRFDDGTVMKDVADLYAIVQGEYKGTPSSESKALEAMLDKQQHGVQLSSMDWKILGDLLDKYGAQLKAFRANPDSETQGAIGPDDGQGRIVEADKPGYGTPSTTKLDKAGTAAHLLDSVLHDLAHTRQHVARILEPDVKRDPQSVAFNAEHALNHAESGQEHAHKLDKHLSANPSDPKTHAQERDAINAMRARVTEADRLREYSDEQPRDSNGKWAGGGGDGKSGKGSKSLAPGLNLSAKDAKVLAKMFGKGILRGENVTSKPPGFSLGKGAGSLNALGALAAAADGDGMRLAQPREDSGKFLAGAPHVYDPLLVNADPAHASEAAQLLVGTGRARLLGQGDVAKQAASRIAAHVGDRAAVRDLSVKGNPYTQLHATAEAATWPARLRVLREAKLADPNLAAADPEHPDLSKPVVAVDFDGTLHAGGHGMPGEVEGAPMDGAADALKQLSQRYTIKVFTARQDFAAVRAWLKKNGMDQYVDEVTNVKPSALAYIDDRAIHFDGNWKAAVSAADPATSVKQPIVVKKTFEAVALVPRSVRRWVSELTAA